MSVNIFESVLSEFCFNCNIAEEKSLVSEKQNYISVFVFIYVIKNGTDKFMIC